MKFLEILLSFLATQGKSFFQTNTESITERVVNNVRQVTILLVWIVLGIVLFSCGFSMAYGGVVAGFEHGDGWTWSPSLLWGGGLAILSMAALVWSLGERRWLEATGVDGGSSHAHATPKEPENTLEKAFAVLIVEIASELREKRNAPRDMDRSDQSSNS